MQKGTISFSLAGGLLAMGLMSAPVHSAIVFFDFEDGTGTTLSAATSDSNVVPTDWTGGPNGDLTNSTGQNKQALDIRSRPVGSSTEAAALANNAYATMTLTPDSGWVINFDSMELEFVAGGAAGDRSLFIRSSLDGFANNLFSAVTTTTTQSSGLIDLSAFSGITVPVEFRIYTYNDIGNSDRSVIVDTFQINGTVIPEPVSASLLALGGLVLLRRRSRA